MAFSNERVPIRGGLVPVALDQEIEDVAALVHLWFPITRTS
jgi:hypothetical protein